MTPEETHNANSAARRAQAREVRNRATDIAHNRQYTFRDANTVAGELRDQPTEQLTNGDEQITGKPMSLTKGLPHNEATGLVRDEADFEKFVTGINTGTLANFINTPLGPTGGTPEPKTTKADWRSERGNNPKTAPEVRAWEASSAGLSYDLEGPDAWAVMMPPAPKLGSAELTAEIAEVYAQAALRDISFNVFYDPARSRRREKQAAEEVIATLNSLPFFRDGNRNGAPLTLETAFRGFAPGDEKGPYLSQFLLLGNTGLNTAGDTTPEFDAEDGQINYGAITIDQRVRQAEPQDYMISFDEWLDVQNGADFRGQELYIGNRRRFITTGRDLSTYVHYDALYEAYLNACLLLLDVRAPFDPGVPFQAPDVDDHQQGFALFGGPHILTLVTEVATRALKAVRYQKFNIHRRLRPEALGGRFARIEGVVDALNTNGEAEAANDFRQMFNDLSDAGLLSGAGEDDGNLLPMAFVEGSPMHPTYGAGHATVAGACVTILKAFFDGTQYINIAEDGDSWAVTSDPDPCKYAFVPNNNGRRLKTVPSEPLTVNGELNKVAANISIGRDWAGVHYYSDYVQSMLMGEEIAIGMLQEQSITYNPDRNLFPDGEGLSMTLEKFDGTTEKIENGEVS